MEVEEEDVSKPSSKSASGGGAMSFSISSRSPGPHFAAQPPFSVRRVRRMRSVSLMGLLSHATNRSFLAV